MYKLLILLITLILAGCGKEPKKNFFRDISLDTHTLTQLQSLVGEVNNSANHSVLSLSSGSRPITIRMVPPDELNKGTPAQGLNYSCMNVHNSGTLAHARYLQYHCLIEVRDDIYDAMANQLGFGATNSEIERAIQLVLLHEVGHCFGLGHVSNINDLMSPNFNSDWVSDNNLVPNFSQQLKQLSE
jgi:hypothetical protein